jgi:3-octaprenyl-4-hydroxybenzoate carboxy-lyase
LTCALMADGPANEAGLFWAALRSAAIWADLQKLGVPGIQGVWSIPEAAGWGITVVSIKQMYPGHAPQVMALAAQCVSGAYFGKYVIVVDDDVDPTNVHQVLWAMATRSRPAQSIDIARDLEHVPRSEPQSAGNPSLGLQGADQRLHGLSLHQDVFQAHQAVETDVRAGGGALERTRLRWPAAGGVGVRGRRAGGEHRIGSDGNLFRP